MALKEKRVVQSVLICDYCHDDIVDGTATKIAGSASGYMKRDSFEADLCETCASTLGLKRRGRRPGATPVEATVAPEKPRQRRTQRAAEPQAVAVAPEKKDEWD